MNKIKLLCLLFLAAFCVDAQAQKKGKDKAPAKAVVEAPVNLRFEQMLNTTQNVMFFDSLVVDKSQLLKNLLVDADMGTINDSITYCDSRGLHAFYTKPGSGSLFTANWINGKWQNEREISLPDGFTDIHYPYMMPDGETIYFSARSEENVGELDLFVTRYSNEDASVMEPENLGLPFNSEANDYLYIVSERDNIGYFATDRNQPSDKVCIYFFKPNSQRISYDPAAYDDHQLRSLAVLNSIKATQSNSNELAAAKQRLQAFSSRVSGSKALGDDFRFVINDQKVYTRWQQFQSSKAKDKYLELRTLEGKYSKLIHDTSLMRRQLSTASGNGAGKLKANIMANESQILTISNEIENLSAEVRRLELENK